MWGAISASARNLGDSAANQAMKAKNKTVRETKQNKTKQNKTTF